MKIKNDFVTNSSSASFVIPKSCLTKKQIYMIINHIELAAMVEESYKGKLFLDPWTIENKKHLIEGYTSMDNFDMVWFLTKIVQVDKENIHFGGSNY
jgi:hypothetical protein